MWIGNSDLATDFLAKQHALLASQTSLAAQGQQAAMALIRRIFESTPLLQELFVTIEFEWDSQSGSPMRKHLAMTAPVMSLPNVDVQHVVLLGAPVTADDPDDKTALADQFVAELEKSGALSELARVLDVGMSSRQIGYTRAQILRATE